MMKNLFSIFDPSTSLYFSFNWLSLMLIMIFLSMNYWLIPSRYLVVNFLLLKMLLNEFKMLMLKKNNFMNSIIYLSIFFMIMLMNFYSLFPYIFASTSHLSINFSLSLSLWVSFMLFGWVKNTNNMFIHLVPEGTPMGLMIFMVIIETISIIIRPGTLGVRLSANLIAGHLLMTLISSMGEKLSISCLVLMLLGQSLLIILELGVALIQAYVITVLSLLYSLESN